jgi:hypothetical protein
MNDEMKWMRKQRLYALQYNCFMKLYIEIWYTHAMYYVADWLLDSRIRSYYLQKTQNPTEIVGQ